MKKKIFDFVLRSSVSVILIIILLYIMKDKYAAIVEALKTMNFSLFLLALAVFVVAIGTSGLRMRLIVQAQNIPITVMEALSLTFIGYFFNNFLPTAIGGDFVKGYYISKKSDDKMNSYTAVFIDRAIGLFTMIFMGAIALVFAKKEIIDPSIRNAIFAISACCLLLVVFLTNKTFARKFSILLIFVRPIEERLVRLYNVIHNYKNHTKLMVQSVLISVTSQLCFFATIGLLALSVGSKIDLINILLRMPIVSAMSLLPSINGLGVREGSTVLMFGPLIGKSSAFAVSILWLLILIVISVAGGLIYGLSPQFRVKLKEVEEEAPSSDVI